jgi:hypothetical protein
LQLNKGVLKMTIDIGHHIAWRWQGIRSCCWLTSIEMLMQHKYGTIYGHGHTAHSAAAVEEYQANKGSHIGLHAGYYNLKSNDSLSDGGMTAWEVALRRGPVLAEGKYGWSRVGVGMHVILIAGVSRTKNLAFYNPNAFAVLPHPKDKISYFTLERCKELGRKDNLFGGGPFWQVTEDVV